MKRLLAVIKKEFREFIRDKRFVFGMIIEPIIMMVIFGNTFRGDIKHLKTIIYDEDRSEYSQKVVDAISQSSYFQPITFNGDLEQAIQKLKANKARVVFYIPANFKDRLKNAEKGELRIYVDSSDYNIYNIINGASGLVLKDAFQDVIQLVISDLETERDEKQRRVNDIQQLVDNLSSKTQNTLDDIGNLEEQFDSTRNLISETKTKILDTQTKVTLAESNIKTIKEDVENTVGSLDTLSSSTNEILKAINDLKAANPLVAPKLVTLTTKVQTASVQIEVLKTKIKENQNELNNLSIPAGESISAENYNIDEFYTKLDENEKEVNSINKTAHEIETTYLDIQKRVNDVDVQFKTLKKEFISNPLTLYRKFIYGEITYFQYLTPAIIALSLFFIGVVLTVLNIVNERASKTLFKLATTPLTKSELLAGKFLIFFLVGLVEATYFILLSVTVFNVEIQGGFFSVLFVLLLLMGASIGLGLLISVMVKTMKQAVMVIPLIVVPSILISSVFSPIEVMPSYMRYLAYLSPLYHANTALREIIIKGVDLTSVLGPVIVLYFYAIITLALGIIISKKRID